MASAEGGTDVEKPLAARVEGESNGSSDDEERGEIPGPSVMVGVNAGESWLAPSSALESLSAA